MAKRKNIRQRYIKLIFVFVLVIIIAIASSLGVDFNQIFGDITNKNRISYTTYYDLTSIPQYKSEPYVVLDDNRPSFSEEDYNREQLEEYSELDYLGRCGPAFAKVGIETMPTQERGEIGQVKPSGWKTVKYDIVDGKYLYNRCHLIGFQLTGENANKENLITGTRYMNVEGMLPFENMVADYVQKTQKHVLYRVTPVFEGENLVASGVQIEAKSVEDDGEGICFNVYVYNVHPGIIINYNDGDSYLE